MTARSFVPPDSMIMSRKSLSATPPGAGGFGAAWAPSDHSGVVQQPLHLDVADLELARNRKHREAAPLIGVGEVSRQVPGEAQFDQSQLQPLGRRLRGAFPRRLGALPRPAPALLPGAARRLSGVRQLQQLATARQRLPDRETLCWATRWLTTSRPCRVTMADDASSSGVMSRAASG